MRLGSKASHCKFQTSFCRIGIRCNLNPQITSGLEDVPPDGLRVNYHMLIEIEGGQRPTCDRRTNRTALPMIVLLEKASG
jgi:hypothetical protein